MSLAEKDNGTYVVLTIYDRKFWMILAPLTLTLTLPPSAMAPFNEVYEMMQSSSRPSEMKMCMITVRVQRKTAGKENILHIFHVFFI